MEYSARPRIAVVAASLDILGGQGVQARSLVDALETDGYKVAFLPINLPFPRGFGWLRRYRGVRTVGNELLYIASLPRLASCDVVHVFSGSYWSFLLAPVPAMLAGRLLNKRVVLHYHSGEAADHLAHWGRLVHPWLGLAHEIVVPSEYLRDVFARHGYQAHVVPNVIDMSRFAYRDRLPVRPRVLSARNLEPYYRVDTIIEAFALFRARVPDATLTVAGYGSEERALKLLAKSLAAGAVQFVGKVDPEHMPSLYAEHDLFVNTSVVDNQPVSILEAFAAGLPVISTGTGDIPSLVREGETGFLIPAADPAALAEAMTKVVQDPTAAVGKARRARVEVSKFTWPAVRERWHALYTSKATLHEIPVPSTVR